MLPKFALLAFFVSSTSWAQLVNPNNISNAATNAVVAALHSVKKDEVRSDVLTGLCEFNGSNCNGAEISLFKGNQQVFVTVLTGSGKFEIPNLKKKESYQLKLSWPKYQVNELRTVEPGQFITINLSK